MDLDNPNNVKKKKKKKKKKKLANKKRNQPSLSTVPEGIFFSNLLTKWHLNEKSIFLLLLLDIIKYFGMNKMLFLR